MWIFVFCNAVYLLSRPGALLAFRYILLKSNQMFATFTFTVSKKIVGSNDISPRIRPYQHASIGETRQMLNMYA